MKTPATAFFMIITTIPLLSAGTQAPPAGSSKPVDRVDRASLTVSQTASSAKLPEGQLTLRQIVGIGLANNPEIAALEWETAASKARRDQAFGERLPRLGLVGGYFHYLDEQRLFPMGLPGDPAVAARDIISGDVILSAPLFTGGRLVNRVKAAELLQRSAEHRFSRSREELVFNLSSLFFSILAQNHVIESLEFSLRTLEEHVKRIEALIAGQKAAGVDRLRTEVRLADVRQQLAREKNLMIIQRRVLATFLGIDEGVDKISLRGELEPEENFVAPLIETSLAAAWKNRDDLLATKAAFEAQARGVDAARAGYRPAVYLQGSYGGRWAPGPVSGTGDEYGDVGRIGLAIELPLFEGGRIHAKVAEQRAGLAAAQERLRKLELQVRLEVETAVSDILSTGERLNAIGKSIAQARESLRIEQQKYDLGKGAIVDVLDAQNALLEAETSYYRVLAEFHTARARLTLARGEE